jgi:hypothetical protein
MRTLPLLLALAATAGASVYEHTHGPQDAPLLPDAELVVLLHRDIPPAAFLPLADGRVVLLDGHARRLQVVSGATVEVDSPIRGEGFDPLAAHLVDLAPAGEDEVWVLDRGQGSLWRVGLNGKVRARMGVFLGATGVARGGDGRVYVQDAANVSVTAFADGAYSASFLGERLGEVHATLTGELPYLRHGVSMERTQVVLLDAQGQEDAAARALAVVTPREGLSLLETKVLGVQGHELYLSVASFDPATDTGPRVVDLWRVPVGAGMVRRQQLPVLSNHCWDCGPTFRVGPAGAVWAVQVVGEEYRLYRIDLVGSDR